MRKRLIIACGLFVTSHLSAQTVADVTTKALPKGTNTLSKGTYSRGKGLEAIQTPNATILIDYNRSTVEQNGFLYAISASGCSVYPPSVKISYGAFFLTIFYDVNGWYAGHTAQ